MPTCFEPGCDNAIDTRLLACNSLIDRRCRADSNDALLLALPKNFPRRNTQNKTKYVRSRFRSERQPDQLKFCGLASGIGGTSIFSSL